MSSFDGQDLFGSGPQQFTYPGREARVAIHEAPGINGARVSWLGLGPKRVHMRGRLVGVDWASLKTLINAIEAMMDGRSTTLVDDLGETHTSMVLVGFRSKSGVQSGRTVSLGYEIEFVEAR